MASFSRVKYGNMTQINSLFFFYDKALIRKLYEGHIMSGRQERGGSTYQVNMRKLSYFTVGGHLLRKSKQVNNLNQTITFFCKVGINGIIFMCPIQFSAGISG
jgi:hypothetical protein